MANISIISETTKEKGRKKTAAISAGSYCGIVNLLQAVEQFYNGIVYAVVEQLVFFFNSPVPPCVLSDLQSGSIVYKDFIPLSFLFPRITNADTQMRAD